MKTVRFCAFVDKETRKIKVDFWSTPGVSHIQFLRDRDLFRQAICLGRVAFDVEQKDFVLYNEEYFYKNLKLTGNILSKVVRLRRRFYPFVLNQFKKQYDNLEMRRDLTPHTPTDRSQVYGRSAHQYE